MDPFKNHKQYILEVLPSVLGFLSANKAQKQAEEARKEAMARAEEQANLAVQRQQEAQARVDAQRAKYDRFKFESPYEGVQNPFEDLKVSQEAARFQMDRGRQQRANILAGLRGAAGASGVAGLAQSLADAGAIQAGKVSADIAKQEQTAKQLAARGAMGVQMAQAQGGQMVQQAQFGRQATLLGMDYGELAGTRQALQQAYGNEMAAIGMGAQMQSARMGMWGNIIGGVFG